MTVKASPLSDSASTTAVPNPPPCRNSSASIAEWRQADATSLKDDITRCRREREAELIEGVVHFMPSPVPLEESIGSPHIRLSWWLTSLNVLKTPGLEAWGDNATVRLFPRTASLGIPDLTMIISPVLRRASPHRRRRDSPLKAAPEFAAEGRGQQRQH